MLNFILSDDAEEDLLNAYNWYQSKEHGLGDRFLTAIHDGLTLIRQHPEIFPIAIVGCRRALVSKFPFEIIYEQKGDMIFVYSVFNCYLNPERWKSRFIADE